MRGKLIIITLQEKFLQMNNEQLSALLGEHLDIRAISLNELTATPPLAEETILYFTPGIRAMIERAYPECSTYIEASRETLICKLPELFRLGSEAKRILVVNDNKGNTEEMLHDLLAMGLPHDFVTYYPGQPVPEKIEYIITSGEKSLIPAELHHLPVIDCGMRCISLATIFTIFDHFSIPYSPAPLARKFLQTVVMLSEKWPMLGADRFISPWFGTTKEQDTRLTFSDFVTNSPAMKRFIHHTAKLSANDEPLHIYGETGTGKRMICQAIHNGSARRSGSFITINCAARSRDMLEKELFGWENNSNTHPSLWETARGGTLCIEEIGVLDENLQTRLLQALTEGRFVRTGGKEYIEINARIITTSSTRFDHDATRPFNSKLLLFLSRYTCRVPPLNERIEDFEELIHNYLKRHLRKPDTDITAEAISDLKNHHWPGNVQELYNVLQYMSCTGETTLTRENLPYFITGKDNSANLLQQQSSKERDDIDSICRKIEKYGFLTESLAILQTYLQGKENNTTYGRTTLQKLLAGHGIALSPQQLRLRLEKLNEQGLLLIRPGRGGTTISSKGELFFDIVRKK